jgi:septum formation protein
VLASGSPRRRDLLGGLGLSFEVRTADIDETPGDDESVDALVARLAAHKATAVAQPGEVVIAADTVVAIDGMILGKPTDIDDARAMLERLSGRTHQVVTGVAVRFVDDAGTARQSRATVRTEVTFVPIDEADLAWYLATGEPLDKAGSYGLQGLGARFVRAVHGSPTNVIGLPLAETIETAAELGVDLSRFRHRPG